MRDRIIRSLLRERFVVTTWDGETFDGLLIDVDERTVHFAQTHALSEDGARTVVDGDLYLPRDQIRYMQRP